jgi:hypothetical protein
VLVYLVTTPTGIVIDIVNITRIVGNIVARIGIGDGNIGVRDITDISIGDRDISIGDITDISGPGPNWTALRGFVGPGTGSAQTVRATAWTAWNA